MAQKQIIDNRMKHSLLFRFAYKCAEQKARGCKVGPRCASCQLNVSRYTDDIREAAMIQTSAEMQQQRDKIKNEASYENARASFIRWIVLLAITGLVIGGCIWRNW